MTPFKSELGSICSIGDSIRIGLDFSSIIQSFKSPHITSVHVWLNKVNKITIFTAKSPLLLGISNQFMMSILTLSKIKIAIFT